MLLMGKLTISIAIFNSKVSVYQRVNPIKSHETSIFLWFSYGFLMVFLWFSYGFPVFKLPMGGIELGPNPPTLQPSGWSWQEHDSTLVSIHSREENDFVQGLCSFGQMERSLLQLICQLDFQDPN